MVSEHTSFGKPLFHFSNIIDKIQMYHGAPNETVGIFHEQYISYYELCDYKLEASTAYIIQRTEFLSVI